jgi:hypothetical protein
MFHVKHFGTIGAGNLTNPHTSGWSEVRRIARKRATRAGMVRISGKVVAHRSGQAASDG